MSVTLYRCAAVRVSRGALLGGRGADGHLRHEGGRAQQDRARREDEEVSLYPINMSLCHDVTMTPLPQAGGVLVPGQARGPG